MDVIGSIAAIGDRLRHAREASGLSTRQVATRLQAQGFSISHATIANYETRKGVPSADILAAMASLYDRPRDWFHQLGPTLSGVCYRAAKATTISERRQFEAEAFGWLQAYLAAEHWISDPVDPKPIHVYENDDPADVAARIRGAYGFGDFPIPSISRLVENYGIRTIQVAADAKIDGLAAMLGSVRVTVVNANRSNDRIRFDLAHELAHHLYRDCLGGKLSEEEVETRAMDCASHLLIPEPMLQKAFELKSMVRLVQYKERFGVSLAAMIFRAKRSRLISAPLYQKLWMEFSRLGWRTEEPGYVAPDRPVRMECLFEAAVRQGKATYAHIAALAGVDERVVRQRVVHAMGGNSDGLPNIYRSSPLRLSDGRAANDGLKE